MPKIALVNELHNLRRGGVFHSNEVMRSALEKLGAEVEIISMKRRGQFFNWLVCFPLLREMIIWPLWNRHIVKKLDHENFDVALYRGSTSLLMTKKGGFKKVIYTRGLLERQLRVLSRLNIPIFQRIVSIVGTPFIYFAEFISFRRADRIIASKEIFKDYLVERFKVSQNQITVLPQIINLESLLKKRPKEYDLLFVGRLSVPKNWPLILQLAETGKYRIAAAVPDDIGPNYRVSNITFLPRVPHQDMPEIYAASKVFIMPSFVESGPRVTLEAMACGTPVVASTDGGGGFVRDGVNGFVISRNEVKDYRKAIDYLLKTPSLRKQMGEANMKEAQKYSSNSLGPRYLEALTF